MTKNYSSYIEPYGPQMIVSSPNALHAPSIKISLKTLFHHYSEDYRRFCVEYEHITEKTYGEYVSCLLKLDKICTPMELVEYPKNHGGKILSEKYSKAIRKLFRAIWIYYQTNGLNGWTFSYWITTMSHMPQNSGVHKKTTPMDISDEYLRDWYKEIDDELKPMIWILGMTGTRIQPLLEFFKLSEDEREKKLMHLWPSNPELYGDYKNLKNELLRIDLRDFGGGYKTNSFIYLPYSQNVLTMMKKYSPFMYTTEASIFGRLTPKYLNTTRKVHGAETKITAKTLRKYVTNRLEEETENEYMTEEVKDHLTSKKSQTVRGKSYLALDRNAAIAYSKMYPRLLNTLPFPSDVMSKLIAS